LTVVAVELRLVFYSGEHEDQSDDTPIPFVSGKSTISACGK